MSLYEFINDIKELKEASDLAVKEKGIQPIATEEGFETMEKMVRNAYGDYSKGSMTIKEAITSTDTIKLIPKVIEGKIREAMEPTYLGTTFFQKVKVDGGASAVYVIPVIGELIAFEVGEGTRYQESRLEVNREQNGNLEIHVKKVSLLISIT